MKKRLGIFICLIFFAFLFTFPAVLHLSDKIIGDGGDNYQFVGFQYIANREFEKDFLPFGWTDYLRYPVGFDLSTGSDSTIFLLLGIFFYRFFDNPASIYNVSILTLLFLNGLLSYLFFEKLTKKQNLGLLGSLIYGFSFYTLVRLAGHANLIFIGVFPFFFYSLIILGERKADAASFIIFTLAFSLVFLASLQYLLILAGAILLLLPILYIFYKNLFLSYASLFRKRKVYAICSLVALGYIFLVFNFGRVIQFVTGNLMPIGYHTFPRLIDSFLPTVFVPILMATHVFLSVKEFNIESAIFLGYVEMAIFLWFLVSQKVDKKLKIFLSIIVFILLSISVGCRAPYQYFSFNPYCNLLQIFPFRWINELGRFYIVAYLFLTASILVVLKSLKGFKGRFVISLATFFVALERIPTNFYLSPTFANERFIEIVRRSDSLGVLDLPVAKQDTPNASRYDLYSVYYQKPIVNGYLHWSGNTPATETLLARLYPFRCETEFSLNDRKTTDNLAQYLKDNGIKTIVLHKDLVATNYDPPFCDQAFKNINFFLYDSNVGISKVYEDELKAVFQLL